ncbi:unnamed protein product [Mytilus edulis]|uniref:Uncharacterized protein n=1 Tax=Mytilus edulis TaxID=6550 RepID=A0A8S3R5A0_MYTED|nr:unnamed protein product [Mytilus edulis]
MLLSRIIVTQRIWTFTRILETQTDLDEPFELWTNQDDFNIIEMTMEAVYDTKYNIEQPLPTKPSYVDEMQLGIISAKVKTMHKNYQPIITVTTFLVTGEDVPVKEYSCIEPSADTPILNKVMTCTLNGTNVIRVDSGDIEEGRPHDFTSKSHLYTQEESDSVLKEEEEEEEEELTPSNSNLLNNNALFIVSYAFLKSIKAAYVDCLRSFLDSIILVIDKRFSVTFSATSGGFIRYKNINQPLSNREYYTGKTKENVIHFKFDYEDPVHCMNDSTPCLDKPLHLDEDITQKSITPKWTGWNDRLSGISRYSVELWKMEYSNDSKHLREPLIATTNPVPVFMQEVNNTPSLLFPTFTPSQPGVYSCILEVSDNANNTQYARRFVIFDRTSQVTTRKNNPLYCSSASKAANFTWQTNVDDGTGNTIIDITWKDHFVNLEHEKGHFLSRIAIYQPRLDDGGRRVNYKKILPIFDDNEGLRTRNAIPNVNSIVLFEFAYQDLSTCPRCYVDTLGNAYNSDMSFDINNCWMGVGIDDTDNETHTLEIGATMVLCYQQ